MKRKVALIIIILLAVTPSMAVARAGTPDTGLCWVTTNVLGVAPVQVPCGPTYAPAPAPKTAPVPAQTKGVEAARKVRRRAHLHGTKRAGIWDCIALP